MKEFSGVLVVLGFVYLCFLHIKDTYDFYAQLDKLPRETRKLVIEAKMEEDGLL